MPSDAALAVTVRPVAGPAPVQPKQAGGEEPAGFAALVEASEPADPSVMPEVTQNPAVPAPTEAVAAPQPVRPALAQPVAPAVAVTPAVAVAPAVPIMSDEAPETELAVPADIAIAEPAEGKVELPEQAAVDAPELLVDAAPLPDTGAPILQAAALPVTATPAAAALLEPNLAKVGASDAFQLEAKAKPIDGTTRSLAAGKATVADDGEEVAPLPQQIEASDKAGGRTMKVAAKGTPGSGAEPANDGGARPVVAQASFADTPIPVADATLRTIYQAQQGAAAPAATPVIQANSGQIGREMGALIKRQIVSGREEVTVRLDPPELGRIHIRLSFETAGELRAVVATESTAALDLLRRDVNQLDRALAEAGVRTDGRSFRFDEGQTGSGFARSDQQGGGRNSGSAPNPNDADETLPTRAAWRGINANGRVDMIA